MARAQKEGEKVKKPKPLPSENAAAIRKREEQARDAASKQNEVVQSAK